MNRLKSLFITDYCPGLNRYVTWLREPIGWFVLASLCSMLVGMFLSPIGWNLAAGLLTTIFVGLVFPWLAVRFSDCRLRAPVTQLSESEIGRMDVVIANRFPIPIWGLFVENVCTSPVNPHSDSGESENWPEYHAEFGLNWVPPFSEATFHASLHPRHRGCYPLQTPTLACSFPFGIWTARRKIEQTEAFAVWPMRFDLETQWEHCTGSLSEDGIGLKTSNSGDFLGTRAFRNGDSLRSVHWAQSAKHETLVVCERGMPQQASVTIAIETGRAAQDSQSAMENLDWRVRIAASLATFLNRQRIAFDVEVDEVPLPSDFTIPSLKDTLDALAAIPRLGNYSDETKNSDAERDGLRSLRSAGYPLRRARSSHRVEFRISQVRPQELGFEGSHRSWNKPAELARFIQLSLHASDSHSAKTSSSACLLIDLDLEVAPQVEQFLSGREIACEAA